MSTSIGSFTTCEQSFLFFQEEGRAKVETKGLEYNVVLPKSIPHIVYSHLKETSEKIQWLLSNSLFFPKIHEGKVVFRRVSFDKLRWHKIHEFEVLGKEHVTIASNGLIAFVKHNCVVIYDRRSNTERYLTQSSVDDWKNLSFNLDGELIGRCCGIHGNEMHTWKIATNEHEIVKSSESLEYDFGEKTKKPNITAEKKRELEQSLSSEERDNHWVCKWGAKCYLWDGLWAIKNPKATNASDFRIEDPAKKTSGKIEKIAKWPVTKIVELSNRLLVVGTDSRNAQLGVYSRKGLAVKKLQIEDFGNEAVKDIIELSSGEFIVKTWTHIVYYSPKWKEVGDYEIEDLKLKIKHFPQNLSLYTELASLVDGSEQQQIFLAASREAFLAGEFYAARRFFEKGVRCEGDFDLSTAYEDFTRGLKVIGCYQEAEKAQLSYYYTEKRNGASPTPPRHNRKCKSRLVIGDADFSFTEELIEKHAATHPDLARSITASELRLPSEDEKKTQIRLAKRGVTILTGIDATEIHKRFKRRRFRRIHWNNPFTPDLDNRDLHNGVLERFFESCRELQMAADRVHVTLRKACEPKVNPILKASVNAGYRLVRKRRMDEERYPGYKPHKSQKRQDAATEMLDFEYNELIFEKVHSSELLSSGSVEEKAKHLMNSDIKSYEVKSDGGYPYYDCSADEDSSDYYETDEEFITVIDEDEELQTLKRRKVDSD